MQWTLLFCFVVVNIFCFFFRRRISSSQVGVVVGPGCLEDAQQSGAAEDADAERRHNARVGKDLLDDAEHDDERVEPVEHGHEVVLEADAVHLDDHLHREQADEEQIRYLYTTTASRTEAISTSQLRRVVIMYVFQQNI